MTDNSWQRGERRDAFFLSPSPSTTYFIRLAFLWHGFIQLFILCPVLAFLYDTHYAHAPFPPSCTFTHTHQPTHTCYCWLGIYIAFRVKKQLRLSLGAGLHHSCVQAAPLWLHSSEAPHTNWAQNPLKALTYRAVLFISTQNGLFCLFSCISINDQIWRIRILSMTTEGHLSWLFRLSLFIPTLFWHHILLIEP